MIGLIFPADWLKHGRFQRAAKETASPALSSRQLISLGDTRAGRSMIMPLQSSAKLTAGSCQSVTFPPSCTGPETEKEAYSLGFYILGDSKVVKGSWR